MQSLGYVCGIFLNFTCSVKKNCHHMPVHPHVKELISLQQCDLKIHHLNRDLEKIPKDIASANSALNSDKNALQIAKDAFKNCEVEIKKVELDIATRHNTINRLKIQQFETRKNDEFTALGNEIIRYGKEIDLHETTQLELMERLDSLRVKVKDAESQLTKSQSLVNDDIAELTENEKSLSSELTQLIETRKEITAHCDTSTLALYEKLLKVKAGTAIAEIQHGLCGGCHMKLVPSTLVRASGGVEITQCENCGRILY